MSDFEINKAVAEYIFKELIELEIYREDDAAAVVSQGVLIELFKPCNKLSDAWPIILSNKIGGHWGGSAPGAYFAVSRLEEFVVMDKNPLRAAMIVFLMMHGV